MPLVIKPFSLASRGERLTGTTTGENWSIVWPSCGSECKAPSADSGKEMALSVRGKVSWKDIFDAPFVYVARGY
jgi:hypothetical protein